MNTILIVDDDDYYYYYYYSRSVPQRARPPSRALRADASKHTYNVYLCLSMSMPMPISISVSLYVYMSYLVSYERTIVREYAYLIRIHMTPVVRSLELLLSLRTAPRGVTVLHQVRDHITPPHCAAWHRIMPPAHDIT